MHVHRKRGQGLPGSQEPRGGRCLNRAGFNVFFFKCLLGSRQEGAGEERRLGPGPQAFPGDCPESLRKQHPDSKCPVCRGEGIRALEDTGPQLLRTPPLFDGTFPAIYRGGTDSPGGFPWGSDCKESACNAGDLGSIPELGRPLGEGIGNPLPCSCLENPMDRGARQAASTGLQRVGHD